MYFCYIDESGDCGKYDPENTLKSGSKYFIICGIIVGANSWKASLENFKAFRKKIAREAYLPYHIEFHCAELIDPHKIKEYTQINVADRWKLISEYANTIGRNEALTLINIVIDKTKSLVEPSEYLTSAVTELYQAFDEFLKVKEQNGIVFFDRANEKHINTHVRKLLGTGASGEKVPDIRIGLVIEDPIFRVSTDSMFIQSSDVVAYTLKEMEFPKGARKKFHADKIFLNYLKDKSFKSKKADELGIIRI